MSGLNPKDRSRSPRYPSYPLDNALAFAQRIYDGVHRSPIDAPTAFRLMGFSGRSGASSTALGAVRQFGLIEGTGDKTRISDVALQIFEPESSAEKTTALQRAVREPDVFRSIFDRFDGRVPTVDDPVRSFLIRELGFSKVGAEDCLSSFRATLAFVETMSGSSDASSPSAITLNSKEEALLELEPATKVESAEKCYRVPLTKECEVELRFYGEVSQKAINQLQQYIELMRNVWVDD